MPYSAALEKLQTSVITGNAGVAAPIVRGKPHMSAEEQIAIYSDAYRIRLRHAVASDYPCLGHYFGTELDKHVEGYIAGRPSRSYNLDFYPHALAGFIRQNAADPKMIELAELESAIATVFMGKGSEALRPESLPPLDAESLGRARFRLRKPSRLLCFAYDVENALASFKRGEPLASFPEGPVYLYLYRHNNEVQRRRLDRAEYFLLANLEQTANFDEAIHKAVEESGLSEENFAAGIGAWLQRWIRSGFLTAIELKT